MSATQTKTTVDTDETVVDTQPETTGRVKSFIKTHGRKVLIGLGITAVTAAAAYVVRENLSSEEELVEQPAVEVKAEKPSKKSAE